jgi:hypothetical protein
VKYLLLLTNDRDETRFWETLSPEDAAKLRARESPKWNDLFAWLDDQAIAANGLELDLPSKVKTVRVRDGEILVSDGPHAETNELVGGYFLVELANLDEAIEMAQRVPVAEKGSVEIRPLVES